jgi:hypothetical protein
MITELLFCKSIFTKAVLFLEHLLSPKVWGCKLDRASLMLNREFRFSAIFVLLVVGKLYVNYEELAECRTVGSEGNYLTGLTDARTTDADVLNLALNEGPWLVECH